MVAYIYRRGLFNLLFVLISGIGGFLLSLTGLSIGWLVGTLLTAVLFAIFAPELTQRITGGHGLGGNWMKSGQILLGIQMGRQMNPSILHVFRQDWLLIITMILVSILMALICGIVLYRFSRADLMTSLYATTPGGLSAMIVIAEDVGANNAVVSVIQTMRVILVVGTIPMILSLWKSGGSGQSTPAGPAPLDSTALIGLAAAIVLVAVCIFVWKKIHMPVPWLLGSMIGAAVAQIMLTVVFGRHTGLWWHQDLIIIAQMLIGAGIGSRMNRRMFAGLARISAIGLAGSVVLTAAMFLIALCVSRLANVDAMTSILAFAPGGIAEMAATSIVLHADSTFVVTVQVLRVMTICILLPPFFAMMSRHRSRTQEPEGEK